MASEPPTGDMQLDPAIRRALPDNARVIELEQLNNSNWGSTAKIRVLTPDGASKTYFLKTLDTDDAQERVWGEYMAMREIHDTLPDFTPRPLGCGRCEDDQSACFYLCHYLDLVKDKLPDPVELGRKLAELHKKSRSPSGKFGFSCTTFDGKYPLNTTWDSNWTSYFTKLLDGVYRHDVKTNGLWQDLDDAMRTTLSKLVPRLLDPLAADGRSIEPRLIHGDLWESNIGTDAHTGQLYIYDACAYYAHHEKELGIWRCEHHRMTDDAYRDEYLKHCPPSEPREEFDDRNHLYSVETLLMNSAHFPGAPTRQRALDEHRYLIAKFLDEPKPTQDSSGNI